LPEVDDGPRWNSAAHPGKLILKTMNQTPDDRPRMTRVPRSQEDAQAAYDRMSGWYDLLAAGSEERHIEAGLRQLDPTQGERVLEIGFGTGRALVRLAWAGGCGVGPALRVGDGPCSSTTRQPNSNLPNAAPPLLNGVHRHMGRRLVYTGLTS
jgi:SAM-dependent methyltransferase